jgi:hypothetical protein
MSLPNRGRAVAPSLSQFLPSLAAGWGAICRHHAAIASLWPTSAHPTLEKRRRQSDPFGAAASLLSSTIRAVALQRCSAPHSGRAAPRRRDVHAREENSCVRQLRMARVGDIVLLDHPADHRGPRSINCYLTEVQDFTAAVSGGADAKRFKIAPQRLLYSLQ